MEEKDFLISLVREMSRIFMKKTNGQENIWNSKPSDWDEAKAGKWKNPTATPKDSKKVLDVKFKYLKQHLNADTVMLPESLNQKLHLYTSGNKDDALCYMQADKWLKDLEDINKNIEEKVLSKSNTKPTMKLEEDIKSECQSIIDKINEKNTLRKKKESESINKCSLKRANSESSSSASNNTTIKQRFLPILPKQPRTVEMSTIPTCNTLPQNLTQSPSNSKCNQVNYMTIREQIMTPDMFPPAELPTNSNKKNMISDSSNSLVSGKIINQHDDNRSDISNKSATPVEIFDEDLSMFKNIYSGRLSFSEKSTNLEPNTIINNIDVDIDSTNSLISDDNVISPINHVSNINNTSLTSDTALTLLSNLPTISSCNEALLKSATILSPTSIDSHRSFFSYSSSITSPEESTVRANFDDNDNVFWENAHFLN